MSDESRGSMFDYDARPVTPQVVLVGRRASSLGYELRDFLSRNGVPYDWVEIDDADRVRLLFDGDDIDASRLPICVLPDGRRLAAATVERVATGRGMVAVQLLPEYDIPTVGAGPAGLAGAVYAASEGRRAVAIEAAAPGGQAGTTSMIENYLGFPQGVSGSELATRATAQARRFGAELLLARPLVNIGRDDYGYLAQLSDGTEVRTRSVIAASGVDWRRLDVDGLDELLGAGVYYGAGPSEAVSCRGCRVAVIGGGNSAGQAVVRFSRYASRVTLLVRGSTLSASMSQYLVSRVSELDNVEIRTSTEVVGLEADTRLPAVMLSSHDETGLTRLPLESLFVCIGGVPRTSGLTTAGLPPHGPGFLLTGADVAASPGALEQWSLSRSPLPLETNLPGFFAAGDVRSGSIKRCSAAIREGSKARPVVHPPPSELQAE